MTRCVHRCGAVDSRGRWTRPIKRRIHKRGHVLATEKSAATPQGQTTDHQHAPQATPRPNVGVQDRFSTRKPPKNYLCHSSLDPALSWDASRDRILAEWLQGLVQRCSTEGEAAVPAVPLLVHERHSTKRNLSDHALRAAWLQGVGAFRSIDGVKRLLATGFALDCLACYRNNPMSVEDKLVKVDRRLLLVRFSTCLPGSARRSPPWPC